MKYFKILNFMKFLITIVLLKTRHKYGILEIKNFFFVNLVSIDWARPSPENSKKKFGPKLNGPAAFTIRETAQPKPAFTKSSG